MSQIKDEIQREVPSRPHVSRSQSDVQRIKLERLMKNPGKLVIIPEAPKARGPPVVPDFVRNVMGSSAGAGSGEFHVYRHLRRKEYARQHYMHKYAEWETLEIAYHDKIAENKRKAEETTAKKRAKRLKKKHARKHPKQVKAMSESEEEDSNGEETEIKHYTKEDGGKPHENGVHTESKEISSEGTQGPDEEDKEYN